VLRNERISFSFPFTLRVFFFSRVLTCLLSFITISLALLYPRYDAINAHKANPIKYIKLVRRFRDQLVCPNSGAFPNVDFSTYDRRISCALIFKPSMRNTESKFAIDSHGFSKVNTTLVCQSRKKNNVKSFRTRSVATALVCFPRKFVKKTTCSHDRCPPAQSFPVSFTTRYKALSSLLCSQNVLASRALTAN